MHSLRTVLLVLLILLVLFALCYRFLWTAGNLAALGEHFYRSGNSKLSVACYEKALSLSPGSEAYALRLAELQTEQKNFTKAERALVTTIRSKPTLELYLRLSQLYVQQDKLMDAIALVDGVSDAALAEQLRSLRPSAPVLTPESGSYSDRISVSAEATGAKVYYSDDAQFPSTAKPLSEPIPLPAGVTSLSAVAVGENGLVSPQVFAKYEVAGVVEEVHFADQALEAFIRGLIYKAENSVILTSDLWPVTELTIPKEVQTLEDLRYFTGLETLIVRKSTVDDYSFLPELKKLKSLDLSGSLVSAETLEHISALKELEALYLNVCGLSNIQAIGTLSALHTLDLSDNSIRDVSALSGCVELRILNLARNSLSTLDGLEQLTALTELDVSTNQITSVAVLSRCTALTVLNISANRITTLSGLSAMTGLSTLLAQSNALTDISDLSGCIGLTVVSLARNELTDISSLQAAGSLTEVDISHNQVTALPRWSASLPLRRLSASNNSLTDISILGGMKSLQRVNVDYNEQLSDILCLTDCDALLQVDAFGTAVKDVQALIDQGVSVNYNPA